MNGPLTLAAPASGAHSPSDASPAPLRTTRMRLPAPGHEARLLGGLCHGQAPAADAWVSLQMPQLGDGVPHGDLWLSDGPIASGRCGVVQWRHNGHWLFGALEVTEERGDPQALAALVERAYLDLFATLHTTGFAHPLRLWNYLPHINREEGGLERYRRFNIGRQRAFLAAGHAAFEGAPAACAIGTLDGPLRVCVLAGRARPQALENPRQVSAYRYPSQYGPRAPTFSRAALADAGGGQLLFLLSGTASIVGHATVHAGDIEAQTHETLRNIEVLVEAAHARSGARFALDELALNIYVRHAEQLPHIRRVLAQRLGERATALERAVWLRADICRADLLVEIEGHAMAEGRVRP